MFFKAACWAVSSWSDVFGFNVINLCSYLSRQFHTEKTNVFCCHNAKSSSDLGPKKKSHLPRLRLLTCSAVVLTNESAALDNPMAGSPLNHSIVGRAALWLGNGLVSLPWSRPCSPENIHRPALVSLVSKNQWQFQDPKVEVLYHIRPYFLGIFPYIGLT